jgi:hypothetical protein
MNTGNNINTTRSPRRKELTMMGLTLFGGHRVRRLVPSD